MGLGWGVFGLGGGALSLFVVVVGYNFRFVHVDPVAQSLGVLPLLNLVVFNFWFEVQALSWQHEFFLELVYFLKIEGLFLGFLELFDPICVFEGVKGIL